MTDLAELKAAAEAYHKLGIVVVPFTIGIDGKKKPKIDTWEAWKTQPQTKEEFEQQLAGILETKMFGVVCGTKTTDGVYFAVIDRDVKGTIPRNQGEKPSRTKTYGPYTMGEKPIRGTTRTLFFKNPMQRQET